MRCLLRVNRINFHCFLFNLKNAVNSVSHAPVQMSPNVITTSEKKKVFVTGSGNIEVTQVSQPISHPSNVAQNIMPNVTSNVSWMNWEEEEEEKMMSKLAAIARSIFKIEFYNE